MKREICAGLSATFARHTNKQTRSQNPDNQQPSAGMPVAQTSARTVQTANKQGESSAYNCVTKSKFVSKFIGCVMGQGQVLADLGPTGVHVLETCTRVAIGLEPLVKMSDERNNMGKVGEKRKCSALLLSGLALPSVQ